MPSMSRLHRQVIAGLVQPARPVFLDAPAAFEPNSGAIAEKAVDYYRRYLQVDLRVVHDTGDDRPAALAEGIAAVREANLIFAGPGSPTYALRRWRGSPLWDAVERQFEAGAQMLFASAAAIVLGRHALPVYEIYKVGAEPAWTDGLDVLGRLGIQAAIVPHFNDTSGGASLDTRFCFMGEGRFGRLCGLLPGGTTILGIDHYTAVTLDPTSEQATVSGQGELVVVRGGSEERYRSGAHLPFAALRSDVSTATPVQVVHPPAEEAETEVGDPLEALIAFAEGMRSPSDEERLQLLTRLQALRQQLQPGETGSNEAEERLVEALVDLRGALRAEKRFDLADQARDALSELGYDVADHPEGSSWSRRAG